MSAEARRWKRIARLLVRRYRIRLDSQKARADAYKDTIQTMIDSAHAAIGPTIVMEEDEIPYVYDKEKN